VGGGRVIEDNPGTRAWRQSAQLQLATYRSRQLKAPIDEAVLVQAVFFLPRPKSVRSVLPTSKSSYDLDKLCRALGDALEGAGVLKNDSRITTWHARKRYAEADSNGPAITGVFLRIYKEKQ
jgi:Holliday junction resolvase RusA-like endonuclease